ncbi:murein DD-endopeptidase MepM/ murein hydrolase activator NlpD [Anaerosolibacter carboniphilus]|uniref:Murein DD-endopeptidase MepM/ murein hydrolase activator NlpD n=1 Tax=Anaerosolibacter carboniphilus TaxID=1417629 RepID=A0A841KS12_9FIRM|nr:M23 family metallopeptidase [Anaerosolibacter carboniphilus]MBB6216356.1 murein DD-endopeptidase MepM/ murein hydrolase activator NlpD [Anaerosolibacter carboniphilus]
MGIKKWIDRKKNKNIFNKKENGIYKFLDKEGFYVILFLCICIVATSAVWVAKNNIDRLAVENLNKSWLPEEKDMSAPSLNQETAENEQVPVITVEENKNTEDAAPTMAAEENKVEKPSISKPAEVQKSETKPSVNSAPGPAQSSKAAAMKMPVIGTIGMNYAADTLVYSKTLDQYATHHGLDIIAPENTPVVAALSGEIIEVVSDSRLGIVIAIAHEGDMITRYANLSTSEMVKVGDQVEKGQTIGGVGKTALFESMEEPHLHFEVLVDGAPVDPNKYLPKK